MNKNYFTITLISVSISVCISFYMKSKKYEENISINKNIEKNNTENMIHQKMSPPFTEELYLAPKNKIQKNIKNRSPAEYIAWLKDQNDRVLLEITSEGTKIYRKGNVTITLMPNGKELYMPDEL